MLISRQPFLLKYILPTLSQIYTGCVVVLSWILNVIGNQPRHILDPSTAVTSLLQWIRFSLVKPRTCSNFNPARHKLALLSGNIDRVIGDLCHSLSEINAGISVMLSLFMVVHVSDVLSYQRLAIRAFMEPWLWVVWWHLLTVLLVTI